MTFTDHNPQINKSYNISTSRFVFISWYWWHRHTELTSILALKYNKSTRNESKYLQRYTRMEFLCTSRIPEIELLKSNRHEAKLCSNIRLSRINEKHKYTLYHQHLDIDFNIYILRRWYHISWFVRCRCFVNGVRLLKMYWCYGSKQFLMAITHYSLNTNKVLPTIISPEAVFNSSSPKWSSIAVSHSWRRKVRCIFHT